MSGNSPAPDTRHDLYSDGRCFLQRLNGWLRAVGTGLGKGTSRPGLHLLESTLFIFCLLAPLLFLLEIILDLQESCKDRVEN